MPVENRCPQAFSFQFLEGARMPHYLLDAANNATELPFADLDSVQSILNTMPTLAPEAPVLACEILTRGQRIAGFCAAVRNWCC